MSRHTFKLLCSSTLDPSDGFCELDLQFTCTNVKRWFRGITSSPRSMVMHSRSLLAAGGSTMINCSKRDSGRSIGFGWTSDMCSERMEILMMVHKIMVVGVDDYSVRRLCKDHRGDTGRYGKHKLRRPTLDSFLRIVLRIHCCAHSIATILIYIRWHHRIGPSDKAIWILDNQSGQKQLQT
jgi:hypothetical protein